MVLERVRQLVEVPRYHAMPPRRWEEWMKEMTSRAHASVMWKEREGYRGILGNVKVGWPTNRPNHIQSVYNGIV
jgi:hypothetical protein